MSRPEIAPIGELPPVGVVPKRMIAQVVRQERFGDPAEAFQVEEVPVPELAADEVLIAVMAAGVNYNNVWAARGIPIDVIAMRKRAGVPWDFHIGGSDASGIVYAVGSGVRTVRVGDAVVVHPGWWEATDPWVAGGKDPMLSGSAKIWGYDALSNFGSFGQFAIAQEHQVLPKAERLTWEEAAAPTLVGTTAYRMLHGWPPHTVERGDVVLVWGGSGGVGSQAIQLAALAGAVPVAVVSDASRGEYCRTLGAAGFIDRTELHHWGIPPHWDDADGQKEWLAGARAFGSRIWDIVGERRNPRIVVEHPGEATLPTSVFVCERGGMVVTCAATTGYSGVVDLRYQWVMQKRLQGSHGSNDEQATAFNDLVRSGSISPCLGEVLPFEKLPTAHQAMTAGQDVFGNRVVLVGAPRAGLGATS
ncbi:MAG: crotonyl-CoA carboxylase/reductase [Actinomycetota bacterium]|nr:crotonyl-CoA carboxylase/reductase [Actinomycetota bacterium]